MGKWSLKTIPAGSRQSGSLVNSALGYIHKAKGCRREHFSETVQAAGLIHSFSQEFIGNVPAKAMEQPGAVRPAAL